MNRIEKVLSLFSDDESAKFTDLQNNVISLAEYEKQIIVVNTWASWSPFTAVEFPILDEVAGTYADRGVRVLAINRKETKDQIDRYLSTIPEYKNVEKIVDVNDFFYAGVEGYAMPETIVYDNKGRIIEHFHGVIKKEELESVLNKILENK
jgi:thiol-disulfide isomerase/thioredoxin